jgi:hypothetical protein
VSVPPVVGDVQVPREDRLLTDRAENPRRSCDFGSPSAHAATAATAAARDGRVSPALVGDVQVRAKIVC